MSHSLQMVWYAGPAFWSTLIHGLLLAATLFGCSPELEPAPNSSRAMPRVVSLSPAGTEVLLELGAAETLIAVDPDSRSLAGLEMLPAIVDLDASVALAPDLVIVPRLDRENLRIAEQLRAQGSDVIEFAPHNFDDAYELCRVLGLRLGRAAEASAFVRRHSRELALMSAAAFGYQRPRVAAVLGFSPLEIAGGHSFTTDLIEIAGAESVTHGSDELRVPLTVAELQATEPDLVLIVSAIPISEDDRRDARALIGDGPEIAFMVFDRKHFWLRRAVETARQLRERVQPLVRGPLLDPSGVTPLDVRPVDATRLAPTPGARPRAPVYP